MTRETTLSRIARGTHLDLITALPDKNQPVCERAKGPGCGKGFTAAMSPRREAGGNGTSIFYSFVDLPLDLTDEVLS